VTLFVVYHVIASAHCHVLGGLTCFVFVIDLCVQSQHVIYGRLRLDIYCSWATIRYLPNFLKYPAYWAFQKYLKEVTYMNIIVIM